MPRIRNLDDPDELRAADAAELDWVGRAPTATPVSPVRDVLLIPTSTAEGDWDAHPPVSSPPVDLGRGLKLTELDHDEAELVMNACTPRGHYFFAVRQFGGLYAFVLDVDLDLYEQHHFNWDVDGVIITALQLSRVVRDNGYSPEFAARIVEHEDEQTPAPQNGAFRVSPICRMSSVGRVWTGNAGRRGQAHRGVDERLRASASASRRLRRLHRIVHCRPR